jgi:hypothetical protein
MKFVVMASEQWVPIHRNTIFPVVIEILTYMSYIVSVGKNLGLGFSGLYLQTSWQHSDIKIFGDRQWSIVGKRATGNALRLLGFGRTRKGSKFSKSDDAGDRGSTLLRGTCY